MEWQPIDTAPKDGTIILFWSTRDGVCMGHWGEYKRPKWEQIDEETKKLRGYDDYSTWEASNGQGICMWAAGATHWMPLPTEPK